ncbi:hypothetical protein Brms1b_008773 [Colletotrichum noveboracense]|nr:hypothetical protein COL940_009353 [Colletotrichum noveboracense]KAJ0281478.1 hypothetical protein CBS470a_008297 [Colletotrichum nupharicola]KAJ0310251.1 hypothetical protein Brms1b_008773 [Colletotrichum noveboracense]
MDPASAFGLAASIVQTITFTSDFISKSRQLHHSAQRGLVENEELASIARNLQSHSRRITIQLVGAPMGKDDVGKDLSTLCNGLETLTKDTRDRNQQIEQNLNKILAIVEPKSRWQAELVQTARRSLDSGPSEDLAYLDLVSASLSAGAKEERDKLMQRRTVESLKFADIRDRYERIPVAHGKTFEWIFSEPSTSPPEGRNPPWDNFHGWLTSDEVLYWVTGKPGSGKSTLMKFLSDDARLRPQLEGWQKDITLFATEKLIENTMFAQLQRLDDKSARALIDEVSGKASGVFLWVTLVVKSLLEGLRDGDKIQDLRSRLDDLPPDLQSLFRKLLEDLEPSYFQQSSRIFQSVRASHLPRASIAVGEYKSIEVKGDSHEAWSSLRLLSLSFIDEDPEEALGNDSQGTMGRHEQGYRAEVMRRQLQSRCKGLLEVPTFSTTGPESKVEYLHRTVKDFLEEGGGGDFLTTEDSFDPHVVLCAALIRHARAIRPTEDDMTGMESLADILREFTTQCHWLERQN